MILIHFLSGIQRIDENIDIDKIYIILLTICTNEYINVQNNYYSCQFQDLVFILRLQAIQRNELSHLCYKY